jgi:hypothetical protein
MGLVNEELNAIERSEIIYYQSRSNCLCFFLYSMLGGSGRTLGQLCSIKKTTAREILLIYFLKIDSLYSLFSVFVFVRFFVFVFVIFLR